MRSVVEAFIAAFNAGEASRAEQLVAPPSRFEWFSVDPDRLNDRASDRSSLQRYLSERIAAHEQLVLNDFGFTVYRAADRTGNFGFRLSRSTSIAASTTALGKGAIDCDTSLIMVWTVGPSLATA